MMSPFLVPAEEYIMIHKSILKKLIKFLPLEPEKNKEYSSFGIIFEITELHHQAKKWEEEQRINNPHFIK